MSITQRHAHEMHEQEEKKETFQSGISHPIILAETDGSKIPIVKTELKPEGLEKFDARKHKEHYWREARLRNRGNFIYN